MMTGLSWLVKALAKPMQPPGGASGRWCLGKGGTNGNMLEYGGFGGH